MSGRSLFPFAAQVRAVLFDVGNTLQWLDHERMAGVFTERGLPATADEVRSAEMRARPLLDPHLGRAPKRESPHIFGLYLGYVLENLGRPVSPSVRAAIGGEIRQIWRELWVVPPPDAHETLRVLRARGYRIGVVSNSGGRVHESLAKTGLDEGLECIVDSGAEGVEKPDPRIFAIAAGRLALPPAACMYVGDFVSLDVLGARAAGMHGVLFDPGGVWDADVPRIAALSELPDRLGPLSA